MHSAEEHCLPSHAARPPSYFDEPTPAARFQFFAPFSTVPSSETPEKVGGGVFAAGCLDAVPRIPGPPG